MNAFLAGPVLAIWLLPPGVAAVWLLLEVLVPQSGDPSLTPSGARWRLQHVSRTAAACAVYGLWLAGLFGALAVLGGVGAGWARLLAASMGLGAGASSLLVPWFASRFHAVLRADPAELVAQRPWPFRSLRWRWSDVARITADRGQLVVATRAGHRTYLRGFGPPQTQFDRVAHWLDARAATRDPGPREIPPELARTRTLAKWVRS